jgi:hypothetical protein
MFVVYHFFWGKGSNALCFQAANALPYVTPQRARVLVVYHFQALNLSGWGLVMRRIQTKERTRHAILRDALHYLI